MPPPKRTDRDKIFDPFKQLMLVMQNDPVIHERIIQMLKLDSYQRRALLNNWLEQLRQNNAPKTLTQILSYLFDDIVADKILRLINRQQ